MKQKDVAALILVVAFSLAASWFVFNALISPDSARSTEVEVVTAIDAEFPQPDSDIFAEGYLNPTELIRIGESNSENPFQ